MITSISLQQQRPQPFTALCPELPKPSHRIHKPAYLVPVPSQDKLGGLCQEGHPAWKWWVWQRWEHQLVWMGWQSIQIVGVSASVIFILHQKIQKTAKFTVWYQLTRVVPDKVQRAVKWLCVSGTTRMSRYQKKHSLTHTYRDHQPCFISFLHQLQSSLFKLCAWQSFCTTSLQVLWHPPFHTPYIFHPKILMIRII